MRHHRFPCWWWTSCWSCWSAQRFAFAVSLYGTTLPCSDHQWCPHRQHSWHLTETSDLGATNQIFSTCMLKSTFLLDWEVGSIMECSANHSKTMLAWQKLTISHTMTKFGKSVWPNLFGVLLFDLCEIDLESQKKSSTTEPIWYNVCSHHQNHQCLLYC